MGNTYNSHIDKNMYINSKHHYGWKPNTNKLSIYHEINISPNLNILKHVDLRELCPPVFDQGNLGSCTANAIAGAYHFVEDPKNSFMPSRLYIYYNERMIEGTTEYDSGSSIEDSVISITKYGTCEEDYWPYDISKYTDKPTIECYTQGEENKCINHKKLEQKLEVLKQCLVNGQPFIFGFVVYESFETDDVELTGVMTMPNKTDKKLGGHAVMAVGYDDIDECFIIRNSWSDKWGDKGYFYMPYEYILDNNLASDFWVIL